jgi:4-amino-4-deoxy-L-arabinose transferase-like glycosyltransferase
LRFAALAALCIVLFGYGIEARALWDGDEGMHAATAAEMLRSGDWVVPRLNGAPFWDKPPLFTWLCAVSLAAWGHGEFAVRLPAALLGLGTVLVTYRFGRFMIGRTAAFWGSAAMASSVAMIVVSRSVLHDIGLAFFLTLALLAFHRAWAATPPQRLHVALGHAALGCAVLAKGPVALVLAAGTLLTFLALRGDLHRLPSLAPLWGILLLGAIALPWYAAMGLHQPGYARYFFLVQNLGNFLGGRPRHPGPVYFYLPVLAIGAFPWTPYAALALLRALRRPLRENPARLFLLVWFAFVLVFFTVANSKLPAYILPLVPPGALLLGELWADLRRGVEGRSPRLRHCSAVLVAVLAAGLLWLLGLRADHLQADVPQGFVEYLLAFSFLLLVASGASALLLWRGRFGALFATNVALALVLVLFAHAIAPAADSRRSSKQLAQRLDRLLAPGEPMTFFLNLFDSALFYTGRRAVVLQDERALSVHLREPGSSCLLRRGDWERLGALHELATVEYRLADKLIVRGRGRAERDGPSSMGAHAASPVSSDPIRTGVRPRDRI